MPAIEVPADAAGERLDVFLAGHAGSRAAAQRLIDDGRVRVDGEEKAKRHTLRGGETIEVEEAEAEVARDVPDARFSIAWEDEHLMVVDKPAGVVVHPARGHAAGTLAQALERVGAAGGPEGRRGIVHRLDRDTSGLLVVARSEEVLKALQSALRRREIVREYLALVEGRPDARTGTIEAPLGRDRRVRTRMSTDTAEGRAAITHFETERVLDGYTLLRVRLETGRTHQIRAHLKAIGHPVAGDPEYGHAGVLGLERQFLHAERLAFEHPVTGERIDVRSPLPDDLRRASFNAAGRPSWPPHSRYCTDRTTGGRGREGRPAQLRNEGASANLRKLIGAISDHQPGRSHDGSSGTAALPGARAGSAHPPTPPGAVPNPLFKGALLWPKSASGSCWSPGYISDTRRAAGTPRCAVSSTASAGASTSSTCSRRRRCSSRLSSSAPRSPTAAAPCCSWAPRSRRATPSRRSRRTPACRSSTTAGSAAC